MPRSLYATDTDLTAENLLRLPAEFGCPVWVYDAQIIPPPDSPAQPVRRGAFCPEGRSNTIFCV